MVGYMVVISKAFNVLCNSIRIDKKRDNYDDEDMWTRHMDPHEFFKWNYLTNPTLAIIDTYAFYVTLDWIAWKMVGLETVGNNELAKWKYYEINERNSDGGLGRIFCFCQMNEVNEVQREK